MAHKQPDPVAGHITLTKKELQWLACLLNTLDLGWLTNTEYVTGLSNETQNTLKKSISRKLALISGDRGTQ